MRHALSRLAPLATSAALLVSCRDDPRGAPPAGTGPVMTGAATSPPTSPMSPPVLAPTSTASPRTDRPSEAAVDDELSTRPMELLRFRFTSGIDGREPKEELDHAKPGQRVYAYLALRNRSGHARTVTLAWKVNGEARTTTDLNIDESWQFRTWGYNTVLAKDTKGTLELEVTDDAGHVVVEKKLPIRP